MFDTLYSQIGAVVVLGALGFAFLFGDEPERVGSAAYAFGWLASILVQNDAILIGPQWSLFAIDTVMLAVFGGLAWKSRRAWPVWATALQGLSVMSHILTLVDLRPSLAAYFTVLNIASYGILVALVVGAFWAWQERKAAGYS